MENILLLASLEGMQKKVQTDWHAVAAILTARQVTEQHLLDIYAELCSGIRVTTRGLTLAKVNTDLVFNGFVSSTPREQSLHC